MLPVVIVGPTATGKTDVAVRLASLIIKRFQEINFQETSFQGLKGITGAEIINADSVQVYKGLDIGSAKPTLSERNGLTFHLIDIVDPDQDYTVADWKREATLAIERITAQNRLPIICGGTGMYVRALLQGWSLANTPSDPEIRGELNRFVAARGAASLHSELMEVDPVTAQRLHPNDGIRIVRAMEVYRVTGKSLSDLQAKDRAEQRGIDAISVGLNRPREELYAKIDRRVDDMMARGLLDEVEGLLRQGYRPGKGALGSLGYRELSCFLARSRQGQIRCTPEETSERSSPEDTEITPSLSASEVSDSILSDTKAYAKISDISEADTGIEYDSLSATVELIKRNTRRFAKRQLTWFRADPGIHWIDVSSLSLDDVCHTVFAHIQNFGERCYPAL